MHRIQLRVMISQCFTMKSVVSRCFYEFTPHSPLNALLSFYEMSLTRPLRLSKNMACARYRDSNETLSFRTVYEICFYYSAMVEDEDLEDGEIESDGEDCTVVEVKPPPEPSKAPEKSAAPSKKKSSDSHSKSKSSGSSSRKDKSNHDEDDFMSKIENALAENLKKSGIEPPMPSVKKHVEQEPESDRRPKRKAKNRRNQKERQDKKRDSGSRVGLKFDF